MRADEFQLRAASDGRANGGRVRRRHAPALLRALCRRDGAAALELALLLPFLTLMLMGVFDFGTAVYQMMQVNDAAYAGVAAAMNTVASGGVCTTSLITTAEQQATSLGASITTSGTVNGFTGPSCITTGTLTGSGTSTKVTAITTNASCPNVSPCFAVAYAGLTVTPLIPWSKFGFPSTLTAIAVSRIS